MRFACPLVLVTILICSTAVSSKNIGVSDDNNCEWSSTSLCNNQSNQDEIDGDSRADDVEEDVDSTLLQPDQLSCSTCNLLSLIMKEKFESIKREDMAERMLHSCYSLQVLSETCANLVADYFDDIYDLVKEQLQSNDICALSGICSEMDLKMESEELQTEIKHDEFYCDECKKIVKHVHESLVKNMSEAQFKKMLMGSCTLIRSLKTECLRIVDQYYHVIYDMLINDLNTEGVCLLIGVCHDKSKADEDQLSLETLPTDNSVQDNSEEMHMITDAVIKDSENCQLCKTIIQKLQKMVKEHHDVNNALKSICHMLTDQKQIEKCQNMIDKHTDLIVDLVSKNVAHQQICRSLSMCLLLNQENVELEDNDKFELEMPQPVFQDHTKFHSIPVELTTFPNCSECRNFMKSLKEKFQHFNKDIIQKALLKFCSKLGPYSEKCNKIVQEDVIKIIDLLVKNVANERICSIIGLCRKSTLEEDFNIDVFLPEEVIPDSKTIYEFLEVFVSDEIDISYQLEGPTDPETGPFCLICELLIARFKTIVNTKAKRNKIVHSIVATCDFLPNFIREPCHLFVLSYGYVVLDVISKSTPRQLCHILHASADETTSDYLDF